MLFPPTGSPEDEEELWKSLEGQLFDHRLTMLLYSNYGHIIMESLIAAGKAPAESDCP